ncbi:MAG: N-acetylmuramic acid 6-phosphate etherase [Anaerolineae bacterium]|nr:N-acetylmuramic acid 6-phosphate etherase [Anaerolineae bacterium]
MVSESPRHTEAQNPASRGLDRMSTLDVVTLMNAEDAGVAAAVRDALPRVAQAAECIARRLRAGGRLIYLGAGTSGRLGVLDAVECGPTFSAPAEQVQGVLAGGIGAMMLSVEGAEDSAEDGAMTLQALDLTARDAVVGIAASGRTPFVLGALAYAREAGAFTAGISCSAPAPLLDVAEIGIAAITGPELIAGSTRLKAGTAQKMVLNMLSTASMIRLGKVHDNLMVDLRVSNTKLALRARRMVAQLGGVSELRAAELLEQTGQTVKPAVLMARCGLDAESARARLAACDGVLRAALELQRERG